MFIFFHFFSFLKIFFLLLFARFELQSRQCSFYFLMCNHRADCPLWNWHSLLQKERRWGGLGGMKEPLMKGLNTATPLTLFPPSFSSLPRGVNLAKRRQHQPIYTSCMQLLFFFFSILSFFLCAMPSPLLALPCVSTPLSPTTTPLPPFFFVLS